MKELNSKVRGSNLLLSFVNLDKGLPRKEKKRNSKFRHAKRAQLNQRYREFLKRKEKVKESFKIVSLSISSPLGNRSMGGRMYEAQQQLLDLQENGGFGSDPKSWLTGDDDLNHTLSSLSTAAATASATGNVDRVLYNNLVEMVPLVQSLIDRKEKSSFTRRGSMIYTKTPSRESLYKKTAGRSAAPPARKDRDEQDKSISSFSSTTLLSEKDREEVMALHDQVEDLKRQLSEKDEVVKSLEVSKSEMVSIQKRFDEIKIEAAEKDALIRSTQLQLSDAKIKLADKQAAVEKLQWEASTSNKNVEKLQEDLNKVHGEISSFMLLIEGLTTQSDFSITAGNCHDLPYLIDQDHQLDNQMDMEELEAAREAYIAAVAAAKTKQDEESISAASTARFYLHSIVLKQA